MTPTEHTPTAPQTASTSPGWLSWQRDGVMVVLDVSGPHLPRVLHWGQDLGALSGAEVDALPPAAEQMHGPRPADRGVPFTLSPTRANGWSGWPGLTGSRDGHASQPLFVLESVTTDERDGGDHLSYRGVDARAELVLEGRLELTPDGVVRHRQVLTSTASAGAAPYTVQDLLTLLPVPEDTVEVADFAGRWCDEAQLQRHDLNQGIWLREQRRGRTGPDTPLVLFAGRKGFGPRTGEVWGIHLGWSGDQRYLVQRLNSGATLLGAGEILAAGEVSLGPGESMTTPWVYAVYSADGVDGASARLHSMLRRRPGHPARPRPIVLNTWEAVTFDMSFERLANLAEVAAEIGVERFVIDDGWFGARRDDTAGLGDWVVAKDVWPHGLGPIVDHVRSLGMDFGLWFEPEMVNPDSDVARAHPGWVLGTEGRTPPSWRNQQVLDVAHPDAFAYLLEKMDGLVGEYGIDFIKWDHNRDLADPVHRAGPRRGLPAVRDQTLAAYRLMDELRRRHPALEIESCSSGGVPRRPRGARAYRPGVAERLHRPDRASAHRFGHVHAVAARAHRHPRSLGPLTDNRPPTRPGAAPGSGAVRPPWHRMGHNHHHTPGASGPGRVGLPGQVAPTAAAPWCAGPPRAPERPGHIRLRRRGPRPFGGNFRSGKEPDHPGVRGPAASP